MQGENTCLLTLRQHKVVIETLEKLKKNKVTMKKTKIVVDENDKN